MSNELEFNYIWKDMPSNYNASYYNEKDEREGRNFVIVSKKTGREYIYPQYEERTNEYGRKYQQSIVPDELFRDQEFWNFMIATAPETIKRIPNNYKVKTNYDVIKFAVTHTNWNEFLHYVPDNFITQELCNLTFKHLPAALTYIPKGFITKEMAEKSVDVQPDKLHSVPEEYRTSELCLKAVKNCDNITNINRAIPKTSFTKEISNIMFQKDVESVEVIPKEFITKEMTDTSIKHKPSLIIAVPKEHITQKHCELAIDEKPYFIRYIPGNLLTADNIRRALKGNEPIIEYIPTELLTDEVLRFALTNGYSLGQIPTELRTLELCEFAVSLSTKGSILASVPAKFRNYEMCKTAVTRDPKSIRNVPAGILTKEFYEEIISLGINIPFKNMGYVKECLNLHAGIMGIPLENINVEQDNKVYKDFNNIILTNINGIFDEFTIKTLNNYGIKTLDDLFQQSTKPGFINIFSSTKSKKIHNQLIPAIRLLRCKYLNEDPLIPLNTDNDSEFLESFGFSVRAYNCLKRAGIGNGNSKYAKENLESKEYHLLEIIKSNTCVQRLSKIINIGENTLLEIITKATIASDYYSKKKQETKDYQTDDLQELFIELQRLIEESKKISEQINIVQEKIQEKTLGKGGALK